MPSKESYLIFFLAISALLIAMQVFVYFNLARLIRRDFPLRAAKVLRIVKWGFVVMNLPIIFLFLRRQIHYELALLTKLILFPFTVWQALIIVWTLILIPVGLYHLFVKLFVTRPRSGRTVIE